MGQGHKQHIPIMVDEILSNIPHDATIIVDGTFGHGGHTLEVINHKSKVISGGCQLFGFERDPNVLEHGKEYLMQQLNHSSILSTPGNEKENEYHYSLSGDGSLSTVNCQLILVRDSYTTILSHLPSGQKADFILLDLGINREHVTDESRGFSFQSDGPLDMRFDTTQGKTAYELIKQSPLQEMVKRFTTYADMSEHRATTVATCISNHKSDDRLRSTRGLLDILKDIRLHKNERAPLFQAIRIAVNHEFDNINQFITNLPDLLSPGGRCAIITFHSIEDRIIKYAFQTLVTSGSFALVNKKVIVPHYTEVQRNKAARSAKLRIIERV